MMDLEFIKQIILLVMEFVINIKSIVIQNFARKCCKRARNSKYILHWSQQFFFQRKKVQNEFCHCSQPTHSLSLNFLFFYQKKVLLLFLNLVFKIY